MKIKLKSASAPIARPVTSILKLGKQRPKLRSDDDDDDDDDEEETTKPAGNWMMTGSDAQRSALRQQTALSGRNRPPEIWFKAGEKRRVRFRDAKELASIWRYSVKIDGKFLQFTKPPAGEVDLFESRLGAKPSLRSIYEVIDIDGYVDKNTGKQVKAVPRFYVANAKSIEALNAIIDERGGLNLFDVSITRAGEKTQTTYIFLPGNESPMLPAYKQIPRLSGDLKKYYAPLSEEDQESIIDRCSLDRD